MKITVNGTNGTRQFSKERVKLEINPSKLVLTVHSAQRYIPEKEDGKNEEVKIIVRYNAILPRRLRLKNQPVKNCVKGTKGRMLLSQKEESQVSPSQGGG